MWFEYGLNVGTYFGKIVTNVLADAIAFTVEACVEACVDAVVVKSIVLDICVLAETVTMLVLVPELCEAADAFNNARGGCVDASVALRFEYGVKVGMYFGKTVTSVVADTVLVLVKNVFVAAESATLRIVVSSGL